MAIMSRSARLAIAWLVATLGGAATPDLAHGQAFGIALGPVNDRAGHHGGHLQVSMITRADRLAVQVEASYSQVRHPPYTRVIGDEGVHFAGRYVRTYSAGLGARYRFAGSRVAPYAVGGVGLYGTRINMVNSGAGASAGLGVEASLRPFRVFAEARMHVSSPKAGTDESRASWLAPIVAGVRF